MKIFYFTILAIFITFQNTPYSAQIILTIEQNKNQGDKYKHQCYAAATATVINYYREKLINTSRMLTRDTKVCTIKLVTSRSRSHNSMRALQYFSAFDSQLNSNNSFPSFSNIKNKIRWKTPVVLIIKSIKGRIAHALVATGYDEETNSIYVYDPWNVGEYSWIKWPSNWNDVIEERLISTPAGKRGIVTINYTKNPGVKKLKNTLRP